MVTTRTRKAQTKPKAAAPKPTPKPAKRKYERKERPPLDLSAVKVTRGVDMDTMRRHRPTRGGRDPEQLAVDKIVTAAYEAWQDAGEPTTWLDQQDAAHYVTIPADQLETLQWRVRNAGTFMNLKVKFGDTITEDGFAEVIFVVSDKPAKDTDETE